jgi:4-amino-4-deoxychorismate lyase
MTALFLLDGLREVDPTTPVLRADDLGVLRGESVFETLRVAGGRPAFLDAHLTRLAASARRVDLPLPDGWAQLAGRACAGVEEGVLRLVCSKGAPGDAPVGFALVTDVPADAVHAREHGVRVITLTLGVTADERAGAPWLLGGVKSTSYAANMATVRHAQAEGADDAVWVSADGQVLEGPTATVAIVEGDVLVSPPDALGILPGTTLGAVDGLGLVPVVRRRVTVDELRSADEVLLLSSVRGVAPVIAVDGVARAVGPVTALLRDAYEAAVRGA